MTKLLFCGIIQERWNGEENLKYLKVLNKVKRRTNKVGERVECTCDGWKKSNKQIESAQILAWTHGMKYTGDIMRYCPWCGRPVSIDLSEHYKPVDVMDYTPTDEGDK